MTSEGLPRASLQSPTRSTNATVKEVAYISEWRRSRHAGQPQIDDSVLR